MKTKRSLPVAAVLLVLCASCATTGRYQTVISNNVAVMTDTATGQAWASAVSQPGGFFNKDFEKSKRE